MKLDQKKALVTGGSQGIGKAIALTFLMEGARVVLADSDEEAGTETARDFEEEFGKGKAFFIKCNVAKEQEVMQMIDKAVTRLGGLEVLVNNAGLSEFKNILQMSVAEFDRVLNVNLRAAFLLSKYVAPYLMDSGGTILNIASTRALMSEPDSEAYAASKGGILAMTHALAISLGPQVRVNAISPGWIEVGNWKKSAIRKEPKHSAADKKQHPVGRVGTPEDVARAAVFLCSEDAGFITGQNLVVDGGMTVKMIYAE